MFGLADVGDLFRALIVAIICVAAAAIPVWSHRAQRRFYLEYRRMRGPQPRERPWIRWGEGLDDEAVGTWDFLPAWRVLGVSLDEPHLELERKRARRATIVELLAFLLLGLPSVLVVIGLTRNYALGVLPVLMYGGGQLWSSSGALWLSRPELEDRQTLGGTAYRTTLIVVAGLVLVAFALTFLIAVVSGRA